MATLKDILSFSAQLSNILGQALPERRVRSGGRICARPCGRHKTRQSKPVGEQNQEVVTRVYNGLQRRGLCCAVTQSRTSWPALAHLRKTSVRASSAAGAKPSVAVARERVSTEGLSEKEVGGEPSGEPSHDIPRTAGEEAEGVAGSAGEPTAVALQVKKRRRKKKVAVHEVEEVEQGEGGDARVGGEDSTEAEARAESEGQTANLGELKLPCNAELAGRSSPGVQLGRSLGVDFGLKRTGVAVTYKGFAPRPVEVVRWVGGRLINQLVKLAVREEADELVVGLPVSWDFSESPQAATCRKFAAALSLTAAEAGVRVYLYDEYKSSQDAMQHMITMGLNKRARHEKLDAYAAMVMLSSYYEHFGKGAQFVLPREPRLRLELLKHHRERSPPPPLVTNVAADEVPNARIDQDVDNWLDDFY